MTNPELEPQPNIPETLHGKTIAEWSALLLRDGDLSVPYSRYGRTTSECIPYAIACEFVYCEANGENSDEDPYVAVDFYMGLVVNDHQDVADILRSYWYAVPEELKQHLDEEVIFEEAGDE